MEAKKKIAHGTKQRTQLFVNINNKMREDLPSSRRGEITGMYIQPTQSIESSKNNHITQYQNLTEIKKRMSSF